MMVIDLSPSTMQFAANQSYMITDPSFRLIPRPICLQLMGFILLALRSWAGCLAMFLMVLGVQVRADESEPPANRVLHIASSTAETTLDPVGIQDLYSAKLASVLFEGVLTYDYLARPAKLVPLLAEGMPEISDGGKTWTIHLKKNIRFAPDPAFKNNDRTVKASDLAFSLYRLLDPALHSPFSFLLEGKLVGLDDLAKQARDGKHPYDYHAKIPGIEVLDEWTLRLRLNAPDANFGHALAQPNLGVIAPEVVAFYADQIGSHPVGTGPYYVKRWTRGSSMTLDRNPHYRARPWAFDAGQDPARMKVAQAMQGKMIPAIPRIEIKIIPEAQSAWLAFRRGETDLIDLPSKLSPVALSHGRLNLDLAKQGIQHEIAVEPEIIGNYLNLQDPMVGGMDPAHIALRRAILMSSDDEAMIRVIRKGQAVRLSYPVPPGVLGHDPKYRSMLPYDPAAANALLDAYGFKRAQDGLRRQPDGGPLVVRYWRTNEGESRDMEELAKRGIDRLHIRFEGHAVPFPDLLKAERSCQVMMRQFAWIADYPDGDDFMQLFYGPNIHANNVFCFQDAEWDRLYQETVALGPGTKRDQLYQKMARMVEMYGVMKISHARLHHELLQPKVMGFQIAPIASLAEWPFLDLK